MKKLLFTLIFCFIACSVLAQSQTSDNVSDNNTKSFKTSLSPSAASVINKYKNRPIVNSYGRDIYIMAGAGYAFPRATIYDGADFKFENGLIYEGSIRYYFNNHFGLGIYGAYGEFKSPRKHNVKIEGDNYRYKHQTITAGASLYVRYPFKYADIFWGAGLAANFNELTYDGKNEYASIKDTQKGTGFGAQLETGVNIFFSSNFFFNVSARFLVNMQSFKNHYTDDEYTKDLGYTSVTGNLGIVF